MPLALSVHNFITSVGADVGFASIIGLAILTLLFFTQHRETANIRRESEELSQRLAQAESRLAVLSRQPAPAPAPSVATQAAQPARASSPPIRAVRAGASAVAAPGAPAGVAAPALAAATRVVPVGAPPAQSDGEQVEGTPPDENTVFERPGEEVFAGAAVAASAPVRERTVGPSPATAAGGANGGGTPVVAPGSGRQGPPRPRDRAQVRSAAPSAQSRRPAPPPRAPARNEGGTGRRFVFLIGGLVLIAAIAVLVIVTQSGGNNSSARQASTTNAPGPAHHNAAPVFKPSSVTVAVLNGTATNELAHHVATKLTGAGYKQGTVATASNQAVSSTVVAYLPGHRNAAVHVATALKLGPAVVQPIDQQTQSVACPPPSPCTANVVVTVGQDLSTL